MQSTEEQDSEHNRLYKKACALSHKELQMHDGPHLGPPGWWLRRKLKRALALFEKVLVLNPENWPAMWISGKIHQRLRDKAAAFSWFERAYQINPSQPDVAREASICAMDIGRNDAAVVYAHRAIQIEPDSAGLHANLAMAYLLAGRVDEALKSIEKSLSLDPADTISQTLSMIIKHFAGNGRTPPATGAELEAYWRKHRHA